jgi:hypothetical protein
MGHNEEQERLRDMLAWHQDNVEKLAELIEKYDKAERELLEREMLGLWHIHVGEVS